MDLFDLGPFFARRSTSAERLVLLWCLILFCIVLGVVCLWFGFRAPPAKTQEADQLKIYGGGLLAAGFVIWLGHRLVSWLMIR